MNTPEWGELCRLYVNGQIAGEFVVPIAGNPDLTQAFPYAENKSVEVVGYARLSESAVWKAQGACWPVARDYGLYEALGGATSKGMATKGEEDDDT